MIERNNAQRSARLLAEHLPWHDIGVMLHRGNNDVIPGLDIGAPPAISNQINPFGCPANKDNFFRGSCINEACNLITHVLHQLGGFCTQRVDTAMHRRVTMAVKIQFGINHRLWFLRTGSTV